MLLYALDLRGWRVNLEQRTPHANEWVMIYVVWNHGNAEHVGMHVFAKGFVYMVPIFVGTLSSPKRGPYAQCRKVLMAPCTGSVFERMDHVLLTQPGK